MKTKVCNDCNETFPIEMFSDGKCKPCRKKQNNKLRAIRRNNPEYKAKQNAKAREYRRLKPRTNEIRRKEWLKSLYKITPEDYEKMLISQNGVCAICQQPCKSKKPLGVDHDHSCCPGNKSCGECIRGLLCANCNGAIGMLQEDPVIINRALEYLS